MNVQEAYQKYSTPKNLQEHMLRVAALSKIISDNWTDSAIDKLAIIKACVMHDITKPIIFNISKQINDGMLPEDAKKLENFQKFVKNKYGDDEHTSTTELCKDLGMNKISIRILENIEWKYIPALIKSNDMESLTSVYCDMRIGPKGILSIIKRVEDLKTRYAPDEYDYESFLENGKLLEVSLQKLITINLNSITDDQLNSLFPELRNLEI